MRAFHDQPGNHPHGSMLNTRLALT
jgi:hypothetical protein